MTHPSNSRNKPDMHPDARPDALTEITSPDTNITSPGNIPPPADHTHQLIPGELLVDRFRVVRFIARGGMGEVYEVEDRHLQGVRVALKTIRPEIAADPESARRFEQEVLLARKVHHPYLCPIYDITRSGDPARPLLFLTMKLLAGETLSARLRLQPPLPPDQMLLILRQLCEGLSAIHAAGIVHRDLKPANVMLVRDGDERNGASLCVSIMDFGLARQHQPLRSGEAGTDQTVVAGTPGFLAPEMLHGAPPSAATDLYAFGVLLERLIVGSASSTAPTQTLPKSSSITRRRADPLARGGLAPAITKPIAGLIAIEPAHRVEAFERLKAALQPASSIRSGLLLGVAIALTATAVAGGSLALLPGVGQRARGILFASNEKHIAVLPVTVSGGSPETEAIGDGLMDSLAGKLSNLDTANSSLWVIPAKDLRDRKVTTAAQAMKEFGATLVVQGTFERTGADTHLELSLIDPKKTRQIGYLDLAEPDGDLPALQDQAVAGMVRLMNIPLKSPTLVTSAGTPKPAAYEDYLAGLGYFQRSDKPGNLDRAVASLQRAVKTDGNFALGYALLTRVYLLRYALESDQRWIAAAGETSRRAAETGGQLPAAYVALAMYHKATGKLELAIEEYQRALNLDPRNIAALDGIAELYRTQGKKAEAEASFLRVIQLQPDDWKGYNDLGNFFNAVGRPRDAIVQFQHAIQITPDNSWPYTNLGIAYEDLDDPSFLPRAEEALRHAIVLDPNFGAWNDLGDLYAIEGRWPDAVQAYRSALAMNSQNPQIWNDLASAYLGSGNPAEASAAQIHSIDLYQKALQVNAQDAQALSRLAALYMQQSRPEESRRYVRISLALAPIDPYVLFEVAQAFYFGHDRNDALKYLQRALSHGLSVSEVRANPEMRNLLLDPSIKIDRRP